MDDNRSILDYQHNRPTDENGWPEHTGRTEALLSLVCIGVPFVGVILQSGPLFFLGIIIAPITGIVLGLAGFCRTYAGVGTRLASFAGMALNALLMFSEFYMLLGHGIC